MRDLRLLATLERILRRADFLAARSLDPGLLLERDLLLLARARLAEVRDLEALRTAERADLIEADALFTVLLQVFPLLLLRE